MPASMRDWPIAHKLSAVLLMAAALLFGTMTFLMSRHLGQELYSDGITNNSRIARMVIDMTDAYRRSLEASVNNLSAVFAANFSDGLFLDEESTVAIDGRKTPVLRNGNKVLNLDFVAVA